MTISTQQSDFTIYGFNELVVCVHDLNYFERFFEEAAAWEKRYEGSVPRETLNSWQLPASMTARETLLRNPGESSGQVRLVEFQSSDEHFEPQLMRPDDQSWDSGGIYSVNIRVHDLEATRQELQTKWQWNGGSAPGIYRFNELATAEWVPRGPNGMHLSLVQRITPPLQGWPKFEKFSRMFNSSQMVSDMDTSAKFYCDVLGFTESAKHVGPVAEAGPNPLGLPYNLAAETSHEMRILTPNGAKVWTDGSIELLSFSEMEGADHSDTTHFPNLGPGLIRLPVKNLSALNEKLIANTATIISPMQSLEQAPYGSGSTLTVSSPEGAWLEFFELD